MNEITQKTLDEIIHTESKFVFNEEKKVFQIEEHIDKNAIRDDRILTLTVAGWSKSSIARELKVSRSVVRDVINSEWGQRRLLELYDRTDQVIENNLPELVGLSFWKLREVLEGHHSAEKSKVIIDAARLAMGTAIRLKELDLKKFGAATPLN